MAIVKFASDKDYQLFIDMELAGKVASESMLKVTLETGGYLIQIKDEDGNLIKEYDLEIKSSDNQLLQKIDGTNNKLDDIIENLKNDSSLVFHCNRASFCHNGRWFDYIGEGDEIILLGIDNRIIVYSKAKCDNIAEYYNAGYDYKSNYVPVYRENDTVKLYGYINFDGGEVIPLIFNWVGNFNEQGESEVDLFGKTICNR